MQGRDRRGGERGGSAQRGPLTFRQAAAFQWVNPKGVIIAIGAAALYLHPAACGPRLCGDVRGVLRRHSRLSALTWTGFGVALREAAPKPIARRAFSTLSMALLLVASIVPMEL